MSAIRAIGSFAGKTAAYAVQGTALAGTQFAQGAREGYAVKSAELIAKRKAALLQGTTAAPSEAIAAACARAGLVQA